MNFYILAVIFVVLSLIAVFAIPAMGFTFFLTALFCFAIGFGSRGKKKS